MARRARWDGALRILAFGLALIWSGSAWATARVALVIGNGTYQNPQMLDPPTPRKDAQDVAQALRDIGFTVELALDQTGAQMRAALHDFQRRATGAEIAAIYYAGHGATIRSKHYLAPVDAATTSPDQAEIDLIPLDLLRISVAEASGLGLVILDACGDNPFPQSAGLTRSLSATRGLVPLPISRAGGEVVVYAAADGQTAKNGPAHGNSPYAEALIEALRVSPALPLDRLLSRVRDRVRDATNSEQIPRHYGSIGRRDLYLAARSPATPLPLDAVRGVVQDANGRVIPGAVAVSPEGYALAVDGQIFRDGAGRPVPGELKSGGGGLVGVATAADSVATERSGRPQPGAACAREEAITDLPPAGNSTARGLRARGSDPAELSNDF